MDVDDPSTGGAFPHGRADRVGERCLCAAHPIRNLHERQRPARRPRQETLAGGVSIAVSSFSLVSAEFLPVGLLNAMAADLGISVGTAGLLVAASGLLARNIGARPDHPGGAARPPAGAARAQPAADPVEPAVHDGHGPAGHAGRARAARHRSGRLLEPGRQHGQPTGAGRIGSPSHIGGLRRHLGRHRARRAAGHADRPGTGLAQCVRGRQRRLGAGLCGPVCQPAHRDAGDAHQRPPAVRLAARPAIMQALLITVLARARSSRPPTSNPICPT